MEGKWEKELGVKYAKDPLKDVPSEEMADIFENRKKLQETPDIVPFTKEEMTKRQEHLQRTFHSKETVLVMTNEGYEIFPRLLFYKTDTEGNIQVIADIDVAEETKKIVTSNKSYKLVEVPSSVLEKRSRESNVE